MQYCGAVQCPRSGGDESLLVDIAGTNCSQRGITGSKGFTHVLNSCLELSLRTHLANQPSRTSNLSSQRSMPKSKRRKNDLPGLRWRRLRRTWRLRGAEVGGGGPGGGEEEGEVWVIRIGWGRNEEELG